MIAILTIVFGVALWQMYDRADILDQPIPFWKKVAYCTAWVLIAAIFGSLVGYDFVRVIEWF